VNGLDFAILAAAVLAGVGGYRLGFLGRVVSWLGLAAGFFLAVRILPRIAVGMHSASPGALVTVGVLVLIAGAAIGQAIGLIAGSRLHRALPLGPVRQVDRAVGAVFGAIGVMVVLWLVIPSLASVPGWPARAVSGSSISRWVSRNLPTPPGALQVLRRLIGNEAPQVFAVLQPALPVGAPPATSPLSAPLTASVKASTVRVQGQACGLIYEGSGFAVAPDLIATNAHVVAGEGRGATSVLLPSGRQLAATVIMFDPNIDIALLSVPGLGEAPLPVQVTHSDVTGAVFGHPNGVTEVYTSPARVVLEEEAEGENLYDTRTIKRDVLVLAASLAHGDSGGPLVSTDGHVVGVAFAISANQSGTAYALNATELQTALGEPRSPGGTSTGGCLTS
jgi:S1-C subfamily serine protease